MPAIPHRRKSDEIPEGNEVEYLEEILNTDDEAECANRVQSIIDTITSLRETVIDLETTVDDLETRINTMRDV